MDQITATNSFSSYKDEDDIAEDEIDQVQDELIEVDLYSLCRICGNVRDTLIPIYGEQGLELELSTKINYYLPIDISEDDILPLNVCSNCATTVALWHEFIAECCEADKRFKVMLQSSTIDEATNKDVVSENMQEDGNEPDNSTDENQTIDTETQGTEYLEEPEFVNDENLLESLSQEEEIDEAPSIERESTLEQDLEEQAKPNNYGCTKDGFQIEESAITFQPNTRCSFNCEIIFKNYQEFFEHHRESHLKTCMQCGMHFDEFYEILGHIRTDHVIENDWTQVCKFCGYRTDDLNEHIGRHNLHWLDNIYCDSCELLFENEIAVEVHFAVMKHEYRYRCFVCDETFTDQISYTTHKSEHAIEIAMPNPDDSIRVPALIEARVKKRCRIKRQHQPAVFECPMCEQKFGRKYNMEAHMSLHRHDYFCRVCGLSFVADSALQKHMGGACKSHLKMKFETTIVCAKNNCNQTFRSRYELYQHEKVVHLQIQSVKCPDCDLEFKSTSIMETHRKIHWKSFMCPICNKKFTKLNQLKSHETVHTGERPFECDICSEKFRHNSNLYQHKLSHANIRKYKCLKCDAGFMRANTFREHMRTHDGERPHSCQICHKKYTQLCVLKRHMESMHRRCDVCKLVVGNKMKLQVHMWKMHPMSDTDGTVVQEDYLAEEEEVGIE